MWLIPLSGPGTVLVERYRLEERLSGPDPLRWIPLARGGCDGR